METSKEIEKQKEYIEKVKKINENKNLKYSILTMGCQLNENDSEKICGMIEQMGYTKTEDMKEASERLPKLISQIDRLAKRSVIHKNKAANLKSKCMRKVAKMQ